MENPVDCVENVVVVQDTGNNKDKALENSIGNEHAPIDVVATPEAGFVDEANEIFTEWSECQLCSPNCHFFCQLTSTNL